MALIKKGKSSRGLKKKGSIAVVAKRVTPSVRGKTKRSLFKRGREKSKDSAFDLTLEKISSYIRDNAYYIWEKEGQPEGRDLDIWARAERDILSQLLKKK